MTDILGYGLDRLLSPSFITLVLIGAGAFAVLFSFERRSRPERTLAVALAAIAVDLSLYPDQSVIPNGLFRLGVLGLGFRLPELVILAGLLARFVAQRWRPWTSIPALLWAAFLGWYATGTVIGLLLGNPTPMIAFHFRAVVMIGGGMALAAGVPRDRLFGEGLRRWGIAIGVVSAVKFVFGLLSIEPQLDLPLAAGLDPLRIGADFPTAVGALAAVVLAVETTRHRWRPAVLVGAAAMLVTPFGTSQRAAMIAFAVTVLVLVAGLVLPTARGRPVVTSAEAILAGMVLAVPLLVGVVASSISISPVEQDAASIPFADSVEAAFDSPAKQQSAQTRINLWQDGMQRLSDRPLVGSGLGVEYEVERAAVDEPLVGGGYHNIYLDMLVRSGIAGLVLFAAALVASVRSGVSTWWRDVDARVAALALGAMAGLMGLLVKGGVESVLEKYRLAAVMGVLLGVISACARPRAASERDGDVATRVAAPVGRRP